MSVILKLECTFLCRILLCRRHRKIEHIDKNSRPRGNGNTWNVLLYLYSYSFLNQSTKSINWIKERIIGLSEFWYIFEIYKFVTFMNLVRLNECGITFKNKALSACQEKNSTTIFTKRVLLAVVVSFIWDMLVRKKLFTFSASQEIC
jgi:hypothetical protein